MIRTAALVLPLALLLSLALHAAERDADDAGKGHDDPIDSYLVMEIEGWVVRVSRRYEAHEEMRRRVLDEVRSQLRRISLIVNDKPLAETRKTEIWVEYDYPGRCQYHPDRGWLLSNGYVAEKTKTVEIAGAKEFLDWQARPVMTLLHELCHAYHDKVLGFDEPRIKALHEAALASKKFDKVIRDHGRSDRHYGLTTRQEYFAEASEAYLWVNDYYPFVYGELREADPEMAKLLGEVWGQRR
jgi:hypothetical protein